MDWNDDGKNDLVAGDTKGNVWLFLNVGTKEEPVLAEGKRVEANHAPINGPSKTYKIVDGKREIDKDIPASHELADVYSKIHIADWDNDGLQDLLIGHKTTVVLYKNEGTKADPHFHTPVKITIPEGNFPDRPSPYVIDWDKDGKKDLLVSNEKADLFFYKNIGTNNTPQLSKADTLKLNGDGYDTSRRNRINITDWNNDGLKDIILGNFFVPKKEEKSEVGGNLWLFLGQ